MKKLHKLLSIWGLLFLTVLPLSSFSPALEDDDYTYKTLFVYQFSRYIQWPHPSNQMVIGILEGTKDIVSPFEKMAAKKSDASRKIVVQNFASASDIENCHILFIPRSKSNQLETIVAKFSNKPVLIVTEKDGLAKKGSCINFKIVSGKLKFELNQDNVQKAGLKVPKQ